MFKIRFYRVDGNVIAGEIALRVIIINCILHSIAHASNIFGIVVILVIAFGIS